MIEKTGDEEAYLTDSEWGGLIHAFRVTTIAFDNLHGVQARLVSRPSAEIGEWPFRDVSEAWIVTAENPRSIQLDSDRNAARMSELDRMLSDAGASVVPCVGVGQPSSPGSAQWSESSRLVLHLLEDKVIALALRFEQWAVFRWTPAELEVIGVLAEIHASGG